MPTSLSLTTTGSWLMRYLARRSRAWRKVSLGLMVIIDFVIHLDTSMMNVLCISFWPLPFDREKLGLSPLVGGVTLVRPLERAADALGEFLVGGGDDDAAVRLGDLNDAPERIDPFGPFFFVADQ